VTISSVRILNANRTRRGFLERVVNPLLSANREEQYTLEEALKEVGDATQKLNRFGKRARELYAWTMSNARRHLQITDICLP